MGWTVVPEVPEVLLHYSEDPSLTRFDPHIPASNPSVGAAVWAIDPARAPLYWFPRDCPRVALWANDDTQLHCLQALLRTTADRVHAAPLEWLDRIRRSELYEYEFDPSGFEPWPAAEGQWTASSPQTPLAVRAVGDLLERHVSAGVELRLVPDLAPLRAVSLTSDLAFSIVRYTQ